MTFCMTGDEIGSRRMDEKRASLSFCSRTDQESIGYTYIKFEPIFSQSDPALAWVLYGLYSLMELEALSPKAPRC